MPSFSGGGAVKGGVGGAMAGSAIMPGWGTAIGAGAGALLGGFGGSGGADPRFGNYGVPGFQSQYDQYGRLSSGYGSRQAPQMGESAFRGNQAAFIKQLEAQAAGRGPGQELVRQQAQTVSNRLLGQQLGIAAGAAPGGGATAARTAALAGGDIQGQVGMQAAQGGLQAQLGAMGMLGGTLQGARGQDLARGQANANLLLESRGINDQAQLEALRQRQALAGMQQGGRMAFESARLGQANQPGMGDQLLGFGMGAGQAYMMGRKPQGSGYRSSDHGSTAFNPYNY